MAKIFIIIAAMLAIGGCTASTTQVSTSYYDIRGNTAGQLDRELRSKGPANGHALASAAIRFKPVSIKLNTVGDRCKVTTAQIQVVARITLPRWMNRQGADRDLRQAFNNLSAYAVEHERTHVRIAEKWARIMEKTLLDMKGQPNCKAVERQIDRTIKRLLVKHDREQKQYDIDERRRLARV